MCTKCIGCERHCIWALSYSAALPISWQILLWGHGSRFWLKVEADMTYFRIIVCITWMENKRSIWCVEFFQQHGKAERLWNSSVSISIYGTNISSKVWLNENLYYFKVVLSIWCFSEGFPNGHVDIIGKWGVGFLGTIPLTHLLAEGPQVPWDFFEQKVWWLLVGQYFLCDTASVFFFLFRLYPLDAWGANPPRSAQYQASLHGHEEKHYFSALESVLLS